ncbi:hypothetical protein LCGC14_2089060 [marine sediment metagenome]|uniref:Uncharacterized protein n=1 Tax=marine sediment metagenome TaxID=412755 RepID=A0A0F9F0N0_9ZZZZ
MSNNEGSIGINMSVDPESTLYLVEAILAILREPRDEQTIRDALTALQKGTRIDGTMISGCNISMQQREEER